MWRKLLQRVMDFSACLIGVRSLRSGYSVEAGAILRFQARLELRKKLTLAHQVHGRIRYSKMHRA
uniref:Uncharacterized protein n=1 Tax=Arundo donax TaxID=35708 RepID=A0A0A9A6L2_ARUDO